MSPNYSYVIHHLLHIHYIIFLAYHELDYRFTSRKKNIFNTDDISVLSVNSYASSPAERTKSEIPPSLNGKEKSRSSNSFRSINSTEMYFKFLLFDDRMKNCSVDHGLPNVNAPETE